MARPRHLTVMASLAIVQAFIAILVALIWFGIASIFSPEGGGSSPLMVMLAETRGGFLIVLALMYLVFAVGAWRTRDWARWVGLVAAVITILYVVRALLRGESVVIVLFGLIIPFIMLWYLLSPTGRQAFTRE